MTDTKTILSEVPPSFLVASSYASPFISSKLVGVEPPPATLILVGTLLSILMLWERKHGPILSVGGNRP